MQSSTPLDEEVIKVISFNVKHDGPLSRKHRWQERKELVSQVIRNSGASIIGVQELTSQMRRDAEELLRDEYSILGFGRYYGIRENTDEHADIVVKNSDASVRYCKTFWLSKQPERYGSKAYYTFFPRICTVAEITLKKTDQRIRVFNTHFDHVNAFARALGVRIILDYMEGFNRVDPLPIILMGDLNATYNSRPIRMLRENQHQFEHVRLKDIFSSPNFSSLGNTFHHFKGKFKNGKSPIDYIFVSEDIEIVEAHIVNTPIEGTYPSDHYPLVATLKIKRQTGHSVPVMYPEEENTRS